MRYHTEVTLRILPVGENEYCPVFILSDEVDTIENIRERLVWGNDLNYKIEAHREISRHGMLDDWDVVSADVISDSDLGIRWALNMMDIKAANKLQKPIGKLPENFWMSPTGETIPVEWHIDFSNRYIQKNGLNKLCRDAVDDENNRVSYSCEFLISIGWVKFQYRHGGNIYYSKPLKEFHWRIVIRYCHQFNLNIDDALYKF